MSIQAMNTVLEKIKQQAESSTSIHSFGKIDFGQQPDSSQTFSGILANSINNVNNMQQQARALSQDYISGKPGVGLNDVMVSMQKSSIALNFGIQMRNKMVSAYQEIMSMPV